MCMRGRFHRTRRYSAALSVLFAAVIAFVPPDLLPHLLNIEAAKHFYPAAILAVAYPSVPTVLAASRVQPTCASEAAKRNAYHAIAINLAAEAGIESYTYSNEFELIHRFQPHKCLNDCDRAPPHFGFRDDQYAFQL